MSIEKQFVTALQAHQAIIHKICGMYCRDFDDRKDLFQEIVIQLWKAFPKFRQESKVSTWVYQIALNVAISDLRKIKRKPVAQSLDELNHDIPDWIPDSSQEEKLQLLYKAMEYLSSVEKALLMLYFEEKENEEIAEIMGITTNNVRVKMTRIREKLRTEIGQKNNDCIGKLFKIKSLNPLWNSMI